MNLQNLLGKYQKDGYQLAKGNLRLKFVRYKGKSLTAPKLQLIYVDNGKDKRASGLFQDMGNPNIFRGDFKVSNSSGNILTSANPKKGTYKRVYFTISVSQEGAILNLKSA